MRRCCFIVAGVLSGLISGCANDPGTMDREEIKAALQTKLNLTDVALEAKPDGNFTGVGTTAAGDRRLLHVKQMQDERLLKYEVKSEQGELILTGGIQQFSPRWLHRLSRLHRGAKLVLMALAAIALAGVIAGKALGRRAEMTPQSRYALFLAAALGPVIFGMFFALAIMNSG